MGTSPRHRDITASVLRGGSSLGPKRTLVASTGRPLSHEWRTALVKVREFGQTRAF